MGLKEPRRTEEEDGKEEGRIKGLEEWSEVERAGHDLRPVALPLSNGGCPWRSLFPHLRTNSNN